MFKKLIHPFLEFVGTYRVFGFFPLDILAHFTVSTIITLVLLRMKKSFLFIFITLIILGVSKEYYDSFSLSSHILEHVKDMIINLFFPTLWYAYKKYSDKV